MATPLRSREGAVSSPRARVPARLPRAAVGGAAGSGAAREPGTRRDPGGERARRGDAALLRSLLRAERRRRVSRGCLRPGRPAEALRSQRGRVPLPAAWQPRGKQTAAGRGGPGPLTAPGGGAGAVPAAAPRRRRGGSGCAYARVPSSPPAPRPVPVGTGLVGCPPRPRARPRRHPERSELCRLPCRRHGRGRAGSAR